jgi:hypothetical protein
MGIYAANIAIERKATCIRRRFRYRKADAQNGIRAQVRFIVGAIQNPRNLGTTSSRFLSGSGG